MKGPPHPALPDAVWINPPPKHATAQDAPGTTIVTADDLRVDPILDADAAMLIDLDATLITRPWCLNVIDSFAGRWKEPRALAATDHTAPRARRGAVGERSVAVSAGSVPCGAGRWEV